MANTASRSRAMPPNATSSGTLATTVQSISGMRWDAASSSPCALDLASTSERPRRAAATSGSLRRETSAVGIGPGEATSVPRWSVSDREMPSDPANLVARRWMLPRS